MMSHKNRLCLLGFLAILALTGASVADGLEAITKPSQDVKLAFVRPGRIDRVLVKEGQHVEANQVLMEQDDRAEQVQLAQLKAQAEDTTRIRYAAAQQEQKKVYFERLQKVSATATTQTEIDLAKLDVTIAELSKELAEFEHSQDAKKYQETKAQVDRMRLVSPIAGKVEIISLQAGESAETQTPIVRVVNIDPLWVDVYVPLEEATRLTIGGTMHVASNPSGLSTSDGKIIHIASVAEAASNTLLVRLEVPNPSARPAGERVYITLPSATPGAGRSKPPTSQPATPSVSRLEQPASQPTMPPPLKQNRKDKN
jgi:RND family efflux transporter MFP subunit